MSGANFKESVKTFTDLRKVVAIVAEAVDTQVKVRVMSPRGRPLTGRFLNHSDRYLELEITDAGEKLSLIEHIQSQGGVPFETQFHITLRNSATFFFQSTISPFGDAQLLVERPSKLFSVQRRRTFRYTIPKGYEIFVQLTPAKQPAPELTFQLVDLSMGGCKIKGHSGYESYLKKDDRIKIFKILINNQPVLLSGIVRSMFRPDGGADLLVGLEFKDLLPESRQSIENYLKEKLTQLKSGSLNLYNGDFFDPNSKE